MKHWRLGELRGDARRTFLKMMGVAAAGVGLDRSGLFNYLSDVGGHGLAEAAGNKTQLSVMVSCGNGVFGWPQELWPHYKAALGALNPGMANNQGHSIPGGAGFHNQLPYLFANIMGYNPNGGPYGPNAGPKGLLWDQSKGGDKPFYYAPVAPWMKKDGNGNPIEPKYPVSAYLAGKDETHTPFPSSANKIGGSTTVSAAIGALQAKNSLSLVPVVGIDPLEYGFADGAPDVATVTSGRALIDLFNSTASQLALKPNLDGTPSPNAHLFETYYNAFVGLRRAAPRSSWEPQLKIARGAAKLIGRNFEKELTPTVTDEVLYGLTNIQSMNVSVTQRMGLDQFAKTMMIVARVLKLGLSSSAMIALSPGPTSDTEWTDPHKTFNDETTKRQARNTTMLFGAILDAFYADLATAFDQDNTPLDYRTVFLCWGDTPHAPLLSSGWPDATTQGENWIYVMDPQGYLKNGWFGRVEPQDSNGPVYGFDPVTGQEQTFVKGSNSKFNALATASAAGAAAAYAVTSGDFNQVSAFFGGAKPSALLKA
jgi:hypothetical protein